VVEVFLAYGYMSDDIIAWVYGYLRTIPEQVRNLSMWASQVALNIPKLTTVLMGKLFAKI